MSRAPAFLDGGGEAARLILARDWSGHPLGPPEGWPEGLRTALSLVLNSPESMILAWGPGLHFFFNDTYIPLLGPRLAWATGERFDRVWADAWEQAEPIIADAFAGRSRRFDDLPWRLDTDRGEAETWFTFSYSRVLDGDGEIAGLFIFTNETTARVLADRALIELNRTLERRVDEAIAQRKLWAEVFETTDAIVAALDTRFRVLAVNRAYAAEFEAIYGVRPRIGDHLPELLAAWPEHEAATRAVWRRALDGEEFTLVEAFGDAARRRTHYELKFNALRDAEGRLIGAFQYARDVTERRRSQDQLARTEEALRQAQKMEAVGQLTGGLAHDFNNLLAGISGSLELMQSRMAQGRFQDIERYMATAQGAARRAAALTHRLLAFSRRQTLDPKPTDVAGLVAGMEEMIRRTVGPAVALEVTGADDLWTALVDPPQLENALLNLCINARDAMPDGGRIVIETANRRLDGPGARLIDLAPGPYLSLCVSDTGTGMTGDVIAKAFDPFFTTKPIGQGTGLGLSMIYGFAQQSGGQVRIESEPGRGTHVCLYLPRHHGAADLLPGEAAPAEVGRTGRGETVLVVDDEPSVRMLITEVLEELGYVAIEAADSVAGLRVLHSTMRIDLLITDVGLPGGMNGRQMADAGRERRRDLKVLFITGYAEAAVLGQGPPGESQLGPGLQVLTKPFAMEALAARIRGLIGGE